MTRDEFLCIFPDESIPDSENLLFAQSAVDFLKEKTSLEFSSTDSLPANAKLFIIKYTELMNVFLTGFGEDMINCEKDEENFSTSVGAQGDVLVNEVNNPLGTVTVTLQPTSPQRAYLDSCERNGSVLPLWVTNKTLGTRTGGTKARIKKPANEEYGAEASDKEYEFQVFDYTTT